MYLERVVLSDIKGFESLDLDFSHGDIHAGWAVITGENASGKTALLRSIALALLGPEQYRGALPDLRGWVTHGLTRGTISVEIRPDNSVDTTEKGGYPHKGTFWAEIQITNENGNVSLTPADVFRRKKKGATNGPWSEKTKGWLAVGYGPFRRLYGSSSEASRMMALPGRTPRFGTLFKEDATLGECEEWMKSLHFRRLEQRTPETQTLNELLELLRDDFLRRGVVVKEVTSDGLSLRDSEGRPLQLEEMSEGYRSAIAMLVDVFRHMIGVYGHGIVRRGNDGHRFVDRPGVVLIDEIDAHLHPEWQREIGFWLTSRFPQVQFIVTTHSPLVCAAATQRRIYHLPGPGGGKPFQLSPSDADLVVAGKPDEILLTPAFGLKHTRSPRAVRAQQRHALLVAKQLRLGELSPAEVEELGQLSLFVDPQSTFAREPDDAAGSSSPVATPSKA